MTKKTMLVASLALLGALALVVVGGAGGAAAKKPPKGKPSLSATPVFKLRLKPSQEVPAIKGLRADAVGSVTFDLTRNSAGAITSSSSGGGLLSAGAVSAGTRCGCSPPTG